MRRGSPLECGVMCFVSSSLSNRMREIQLICEFWPIALLNLYSHLFKMQDSGQSICHFSTCLNWLNPLSQWLDVEKDGQTNNTMRMKSCQKKMT